MKAEGASQAESRERNARRAHRDGFTLIELMVVIAIIGIFFTTLMGAMYGALDAAKSARSKQVVTKLHNQIMTKWEGYQTRKLPVNAAIVAANNAPLNAMLTSQAQLALARAKLGATRELMRVEMPDTYLDIQLGASQLTKYLTVPKGTSMEQYIPRTNYVYQSYMAAAPLRMQPPGTPTVFTAALSTQLQQSPSHESAECLFMTVTLACEDRDATALAVSVPDTSDLDLDGMPEFRDGWSNPVYWIRWPAGFISDMQVMYSINQNDQRFSQVQPLDPNITGNRLTRDPPANHDSFDPLQVDRWEANPPPANWPFATWVGQKEKGYTLLPLIFSAGPGFDAAASVFPLEMGILTASATGDPPFDLNNRSNPYYYFSSNFSGNLVQAGTWIDASPNKNQIVHNQTFGGRQ